MAAIEQAIDYRDIKDHYSFGQTLGHGKSIKVKAAVHRLTGEEVAVKILNKTEKEIDGRSPGRVFLIHLDLKI